MDDPSGLVVGLILALGIVFFVCLALKLRIFRQGGGDMMRMWSLKEMRRTQNSLPDPVRRRVVLLDRIGTIAWICGFLIIAVWRYKN